MEERFIKLLHIVNEGRLDNPVHVLYSTLVEQCTTGAEGDGNVFKFYTLSLQNFPILFFMTKVGRGIQRAKEQLAS